MYFGTNRRVPKTTDSLFSIYQQDGEFLREFMVRFNTATLEVKDLDEATAIAAMKRGLRNFKFTYSLDMTLPRSYVELLECIQKYIHTEEAATDRRQFEEKSQKKKARKGGGSREPSRIRAEHEAPPPLLSQKPKNFMGRYDSYTPLTTFRL